jgi:hypothetical protein
MVLLGRSDALVSLDSLSEFLAEFSKFLISDQARNPHRCHHVYSSRPAHIIEDRRHIFVLFAEKPKDLQISFVSRRRCVGARGLNIRQNALTEPIYRDGLQATQQLPV